VPKGEILEMEGGSRFEGCGRGGGQHVKCAKRQDPEIDEGDANSMFSFTSIFPIGTVYLPGYFRQSKARARAGAMILSERSDRHPVSSLTGRTMTPETAQDAERRRDEILQVVAERRRTRCG
jgi:hypothetical protein